MCYFLITHSFFIKFIDEILKKIESLLNKLNQYYKVYNVQNDKPNQNMHIHAARIDKENMWNKYWVDLEIVFNWLSIKK